MNRVERIYHPEAIRERATLRRQIEADLPIVTPVWVAGPGGAAMCATPARTAGGGATTHGHAAARPFPKPRNHAEEIANALAEDEAARRG